MSQNDNNAFMKSMISSMKMDDHEKNLKKIFSEFIGVSLIEDREAKEIVSKISSDLARDLRKEDEIMFSRLSVFISDEISRRITAYSNLNIANKSGTGG